MEFETDMQLDQSIASNIPLKHIQNISTQKSASNISGKVITRQFTTFNQKMLRASKKVTFDVPKLVSMTELDEKVKADIGLDVDVDDEENDIFQTKEQESDYPKIQALLMNTYFTSVLYFFTFYALFAEDCKLLLFTKEAD